MLGVLLVPFFLDHFFLFLYSHMNKPSGALPQPKPPASRAFFQRGFSQHYNLLVADHEQCATPKKCVPRAVRVELIM